jgi:hypothetical protein
LFSGSAAGEEEVEMLQEEQQQKKKEEDVATVEDLPGMIGSEEEYARILRKPLRPALEEKVEEPPELSESEVRGPGLKGHFH